jgi:predicted nucleotidyltransferase
MSQRIVDLANAIRVDRYRDATVVFVAGSIVRGEGTAYSDLDLVVMYPRLACAARESFTRDGYPVEAFLHDRETLEYFFDEVDRPSGVPALPQMVVEGIEIPAPSDVSRALKQRAAALIAAGPPPLDTEAEQRRRYVVTDLLDDIRGARSHEELVAAGARLYDELADYHLRRLRQWSGKGKAIPPAMRRLDAELCARYCRSFDDLFRLDDARGVIELTEELLQPAGGLLFDGYRSDAPAGWRKSDSDRVL